MAKEVHSTSTEGFSTQNKIREFETTIDATGEDAPDTLETLLATYSACFVPALRVGSEQRGGGDLGEIEIAVTGELNDDDKLESISFDVTTEADLDDETAAQVNERAQELCKVHDALKESLHADVTLNS
ncbi:OsmC family protein [Natranaeroarchaeum aerophilus]|uniref:OsmC family protein n=1 Tax=Natranaeroarchaeum aerophilus TaxID=2917711 RepID=A0AAE3FP96_9EURY|nr:OsmC family protein [Natranaeroarchaeum aerophilus]MCL9813107.1 OsmC family protein [Natranaeroarchaeum aerophilus]